MTPQPEPEHAWLVNAGLTACTRFPASAALKVRMVRNALHPASGMRLSEVVVLHHVADPQVFVIDHIVRLHQLARFLVVEVTALARDVLMRLWRAA